MEDYKDIGIALGMSEQEAELWKVCIEAEECYTACMQFYGPKDSRTQDTYREWDRAVYAYVYASEH